jgi:hypothetical protein
MIKLVVNLSAILLLSYPLMVYGQRENENCLIIRSRILEVPDSSFSRENSPPEGAYVVVKYRVLKVLKGSYENDEIKVAQGVSSSRNLRVGDQVVLEVKLFKDLREEADFLREFGIERSDERIADFVFVRFRPTFSSFSQFPCTDPTL